MTRSKWKPFFVNSVLYYQLQEIKKINKSIENNSLINFQTWSRQSVILSQFRGLTIQVYNGQKFVPLKIDSKLAGHKLGEFSLTKKIGPLIHILGKKKKK